MHLLNSKINSEYKEYVIVKKTKNLPDEVDTT